jgi:calcineurin-like phosphoesterase family protein
MTIFLISDTHFGHESMLKFKNSDGSPVRSFSSVEEMDEIMVENWNKVVGHSDKVYHLGDVAMSKKSLPILSRLNGKKTLIAGNHDVYDTKEYMKYFKNVRGYRVIEDSIILSHIPIHKDSLERYGFNIHGHLHAEVMNDPNYFCVSVEQINYTPIALEEIKFIREKNEK